MPINSRRIPKFLFIPDTITPKFRDNFLYSQGLEVSAEIERGGCGARVLYHIGFMYGHRDNLMPEKRYEKIAKDILEQKRRYVYSGDDPDWYRCHEWTHNSIIFDLLEKYTNVKWAFLAVRTNFNCIKFIPSLESIPIYVIQGPGHYSTVIDSKLIDAWDSSEIKFEGIYVPEKQFTQTLSLLQEQILKWRSSDNLSIKKEASKTRIILAS